MSCIVTFIGLPGCGKSTIGRQLARQWNGEFVDSDSVLERRLGCSIKEYFSNHGEVVFRDVEAKVIAELVGNNLMPCVLSTGGGAVLRPENRAV